MDGAFCKTFTGGPCPNWKNYVYIPREWCYKRCNYKKSYPKIGTMAGQFVAESRVYVRAGRPKRSDAEVHKITAICEACDEFDNKRGRCYLCGCNMYRKMTWATTHCPLNKWEQ